MIPVRDILGCGGVPADRTAASEWLRRNGVATQRLSSKRTAPEYVSLAALPEDVRIAYRLKHSERLGLSAGVQDDEAHRAFDRRAPGVQAEGARRKAVVAIVRRLRAAGLGWGELASEARRELAEKGLGAFPSAKTLARWGKRIEGVELANWAPALAPEWQGRTARAEVSAEAWKEFLFLWAASSGNGRSGPIVEAYRTVAAMAPARGWTWPSERTVLRLVDEMDPIQRRAIELGEAEAVKATVQFQPRTTEGMRAMDLVELDGKEFGVLRRWPDGRVDCPWVIIVVDRASSMPLGWAISHSENAPAVRDAIMMAAERYGCWKRLLTDNGAAINSHMIAGGLDPLFRTKQKRKPHWDEVPGVLKILHSELQNTAPRKPRGKLPESIFSALRYIEAAPEFHGARRPGPNDPKPERDPVPIDDALFAAVFERRMREFIDRPCRVQAARKGETRRELFARLSEGRIVRPLTPRQRQQASMTWHRRTVSRDGRVSIGGQLYGSAETQAEMLRFEGQRLLIGVPKEGDALVYRMDAGKWRELPFTLPPVLALPVLDQQGRRNAVAEERRVKELMRSHAIPDFDAKLADLRTAALEAPGESIAPAKRSVVVQLDTDSPFGPPMPASPPPDRAAEARARETWERRNAGAALWERAG